MSKKEIVINATRSATRIAILEDKELVELHIENEENERTIGNVYLGRIRRVMGSIRAAFVDIGQEQDAFLHFSDLSEHLPQQLAFADAKNPQIADFASGVAGDDEDDDELADEEAETTSGGPRRRSRRRATTDKDGKPLESHLKEGKPIIVKVTKEPISHKGSRISCDISLAGRFLVLVPFADYIAVSKKINSQKERRRLRALSKSLLPPGFGVIVRTVAKGRDARSLDTDLRLLLDKWKKLEDNLQGAKPPKLLFEDVNMVSSIMRDLFSTDYDRVLVDNQRVYRNIKGYVDAVAPQMSDQVQLYKGRRPVFEEVDVAHAVAEAFERRVQLPCGGYLFFEQTEAMHVVDVNSGRAGKGMKQEDSSLKVNIEAAQAIARQARLRDLGGILVVDFIDMRSDKNRRKVYDELKKEFRKDRAVTKILPMSDFGVMQITRQRLRPSLNKTFDNPEEAGFTAEGLERAKERLRQKRLEELAAAELEQEEGPKPENGQAKEQKEEAPKQESRPEPKPQERRTEGRPQAPAPHPRSGMEPDVLVEHMAACVAAYRDSGDRGVLTLRVHPYTAAFLNRRVPNHPTRWFMRFLVRVRVEQDPTLAPLSFQFFHEDKDVTDELLPEELKPKPQENQDRRRGGQRRSRGGQGRSGKKPQQERSQQQPVEQASS